MIITQTPLRISFAGGGTDFGAFYRKEEGVVISSAIDKYVFVIVKERFDDSIYVNYSQKEIVECVGEIQHELVREAMRKTGVDRGVEITFLADIPSEGSGLGSSGSVTVGLLNALYAYDGIFQPAEVLAREACEIEIDILGKPIGKQDQYIAAYGGLCHFTLRPDGKVEVERIRGLNGNVWRQFGSNLLLFYTDRTRKSETILGEQRDRVEENRETLRHIRDLAFEVRQCLLAGEFDRVGGLLHQGWLYKRELASRITDDHLDGLYERALDAGALGGKISGAGGGGFLLLYCPRERQNQLRKALSDLRELPFFLERDGSKVIFNVRRYDAK